MSSLKPLVFFSVLDKIILSAQSHLPAIIVAAFYDVSDYGDFMYSYSVAILISCLVVFIDDKVVKNEYLDKKNSTLFPLLSLIRTLIIVIVSFLFILISSLWIKNDSLLRIFQFTVFFAVSAISYGHIIKLESDLNLRKLSIIHVFSFVISITLCFYFSLNKFPIEYNIYAMISGATLNFIFLFSTSDFVIRSKDVFGSKKVVKKILKQSAPFGIAAVSYMVYMRMDTVMIDYFLTKDDVGIYSLAVQAITISTLVLAPIQVIAFPKLKEMYKINHPQYHNKLIQFTSFGVLLFLLGFIIIASLMNYLIYWNYQDFSESLTIIFILFFSSLCTAVSVLRSSHITFEGLGNYLLYSQIIALFINLLLNFILIPIYGIIGAAISTLVSQLCGLILSNLFFKKLKMYLKIQLKSLNVLNVLKLIK
jgi:O-antigen/teichoic acid export membrane protein